MLCVRNALLYNLLINEESYLEKFKVLNISGQSDRGTYQNAPFTAINTAESPVDITKSYQGY